MPIRSNNEFLKGPSGFDHLTHMGVFVYLLDGLSVMELVVAGRR